MASRIIHTAIASLVVKTYPIFDCDRFFFTNEMVDEFIAIAYQHSVEELAALDEGSIKTDMLQMAWECK